MTRYLHAVGLWGCRCSGFGLGGRLGQGNNDSLPIFHPVAGLDRIRVTCIAASDHHTLAVTDTYSLQHTFPASFFVLPSVHRSLIPSLFHTLFCFLLRRDSKIPHPTNTPCTVSPRFDCFGPVGSKRWVPWVAVRRSRGRGVLQGLISARQEKRLGPL